MAYIIKVEIWDDDADMRIAAAISEEVSRCATLSEWRAALRGITPTVRQFIDTIRLEEDISNV